MYKYLCIILLFTSFNTTQSMQERELLNSYQPIALTFKKGLFYQRYHALLANGADVKAYKNHITHHKSAYMKHHGKIVPVHKDCFYVYKNLYKQAQSKTHSFF